MKVSIETQIEILNRGVATMTTLIQLTLIGLAIFMEVTKVGEAFGFALFLACAYTVLHWFDKWQNNVLESKVREQEVLIESQKKYIDTLMKHKRRSYD